MLKRAKLGQPRPASPVFLSLALYPVLASTPPPGSSLLSTYPMSSIQAQHSYPELTPVGLSVPAQVPQSIPKRVPHGSGLAPAWQGLHLEDWVGP